MQDTGSRPNGLVGDDMLNCMAHLKNSPSLFLDALGRRPTVRRPIWFMRQAGRYLPEYNEVRKKAGSFLALCKNPELAYEVTLQPVERFDLDAAIIFSDILTIPDAMGLGLEFVDGEGPKFARPLRNEKDILNLAVPVPEEALDYVMQTVRLCRQKLADQVPLIGFSGSPFTLACYMVEGGSPGEFFHIKSLRYTRPQLLHHLLKINAEAVAAYLCAQINCGAQVVMIFDTWGGVLSQEDFAEFSLPYLTQILGKVKNKNPHIPCIVFVKGGGGWLEMQTQTGADALGVDWSLPLSQARARVGNKVALQGNLDPLSLMGTAAEVKKQTLRVLDGFGQGPGHIFNLGHGIHRLTPLANVEVMVKTVKEYRT